MKDVNLKHPSALEKIGYIDKASGVSFRTAHFSGLPLFKDKTKIILLL